MWVFQIQSKKYIRQLGRASIAFCMRKSKHFHNPKKPVDLDSYKIVEVRNNEQCLEACEILNSHCHNVAALGFDYEWTTKNGVQRPVALLQLASSQGLCCLFRLNLLQNIPRELQDILSNDRIIKLGISPITGKKFLKKDYNTKVHGTLDLRHLYPTNKGLVSLAGETLDLNLSRLTILQCCNWENIRLTKEEKYYAAKDALAAIKIFQKWLLENKESNDSEIKASDLASKKIEKTLTKRLDVPFRYF